MKKTIVVLLLFLCLNINGQSLVNGLRYSQDDLSGTARYSAMGGAYTAIGGDFSAFSINPAASGVFAFSEASVSLNTFDLSHEASYFNTLNTNHENGLDLNQIGVVLVLIDNTEQDWSKLSFGFNYQKTANLNENYFVSGTNPNRGIDQYFLDNAQGYRFADVSQLQNDEDFYEAYINIGETVGYEAQQGLFGYEGYIINPVDPVDEFGNTTLDQDEVREYTSNAIAGPAGFIHSYARNASGGIKKSTFNISGVYQNKLFLGFNFNIHRIDHTEYVVFDEEGYATNSDLQELRFVNELSTVAEGNSFQLGMIYKLNDQLRFGVSLESPTYYLVNEQLRQSLNSQALSAPSLLDLNPGVDLIFPDYKLHTPGSVRAGLAYIFSDKGVISIDFSRLGYHKILFRPEINEQINARNQEIEDSYQASDQVQLGGEFRVSPQISLRAGYFQAAASQRQFDNSRKIISGGIGYSFGASNIDLSVQSLQYADNHPLFDTGLTDLAILDREKLNINLTYRLKL